MEFPEYPHHIFGLFTLHYHVQSLEETAGFMRNLVLTLEKRNNNNIIWTLL